jgi:hypothetical protein
MMLGRPRTRDERIYSIAAAGAAVGVLLADGVWIWLSAINRPVIGGALAVIVFVLAGSPDRSPQGLRWPYHRAVNSSGRRSVCISRDASLRAPLAGHVGVMLATVALMVAACGSSTPTVPPGSPATASVQSLGPTASSPSPSSSAGLEAPTPEPALTARIPEVDCPTTFGLPGETMPPIPTTMTATLTPDVAALVTFYGNGTLTLLGPKDWRCEAAVGVDGSASMTITPPGQARPAGSPSPDDQAVTASTGGACVGCIASMACGLFPEAWNLFAQPGLSCPSTPPSRELVTRPRPRSAVFEDPPGVAGTGEPSGGRYRALGFLVFNPGTEVGGSGLDLPSAFKLTCTLPDTMAQICDEVVEGIGQQ